MILLACDPSPPGCSLCRATIQRIDMSDEDVSSRRNQPITNHRRRQDTTTEPKKQQTGCAAIHQLEATTPSDCYCARFICETRGALRLASPWREGIVQEGRGGDGERQRLFLVRVVAAAGQRLSPYCSSSFSWHTPRRRRTRDFLKTDPPWSGIRTTRRPMAERRRATTSTST